MDHDAGGLKVFESGAILCYLAGEVATPLSRGQPALWRNAGQPAAAPSSPPLFFFGPYVLAWDLLVGAVSLPRRLAKVASSCRPQLAAGVPPAPCCPCSA